MAALDGIRVVDLSRVLAGPLCTQMLADHGADVIKIEPPAGDETRLFGPPFDDAGDAAYFGAVNRGKRSLSLDLAHPDGAAVLEKLLAHADVLVENFLPGTMEKWGLGYETLAQRHPRLVYCAISGFGADGPLGGLPGYDAVLQAMCGLMSVNGSEDSGPMRLGIPSSITHRLRRDERHPDGAHTRASAAAAGSASSHPVRYRHEPARAARRELVHSGARRACSAARIRTSVPTTSSSTATARSSSVSPTTASSASCASTSADPTSPPIRASRPTRSGWSTGMRSGPSSRRRLRRIRWNRFAVT
jgi:hypothetical protein